MSMVKANPYDLTPDSLHNLSDLVREDGNYNEGRLADTLDAAAERLRDLASRDSTPPPAPSAVHPLLLAFAEATKEWTDNPGAARSRAADRAQLAWQREDCPIYAERATPSPAPPAPAGEKLKACGFCAVYKVPWVACPYCQGMDLRPAPAAPLSAGERKAAEAMREMGARMASHLTNHPPANWTSASEDRTRQWWTVAKEWDAARTPSPAPPSAAVAEPLPLSPDQRPWEPGFQMHYAVIVTRDGGTQEVHPFRRNDQAGAERLYRTLCANWSDVWLMRSMVQEPAPSTEAPAVCTPPNAKDCPRCGRCTCPRKADSIRRYSVPECPLHGLGAQHAIGQLPEHVEPRRAARPVPSVEAPPARTVRERWLEYCDPENEGFSGAALQNQLSALIDVLQELRDQDRAERDGGRGVKRG